MAVLARLGGVQPSEYEDMTHADAVALAGRLRKMKEQEMNFQVEMVKVLVKACGARVG